VLEVFQEEHNYIDIQDRLNLILVFAIPLTLLVAVVAGWWIARAALRPINRISRTVRSIGESRDLSRRLDFVGPYDEVGRLAVTFDGMMDRLEKVFETQKRFVADASHELRTPLTAIRGNADLYSRAPPDERDLCVASIRREAERMSRLVADLLLLAAADIEEQPVHKKPVVLDELLRDVYRAALILASDNVTVSLDAQDGVMIEADADRIKQLVLNLVDNAVKFTPTGGHVTISLRASPAGAVIGVADTGIGIALEEQQAIFDRFYRVDHARAKRGSGLGLSISSWIAAAHGGHIEVESRPGAGSTFTVHLPGPVSLEASPAPEVISRPAE
jgi:signal transduction histidine kinase